MSSANSRLDRPILTHRRAGILLFGKPRRGWRHIIVRPKGQRAQMAAVPTRRRKAA